MKFYMMAALLVAALVALPVSAKEKVAPAVNASTEDAFVTVSTWVRGQMDNGGRYSFVTTGERNTVNADLDLMGKLMAARGSVDKMTPDEKTEMFNRQEEVNAILAKRDRERLVCTYERPIGSNLPVKTCRTAGEIADRKGNDREYLERRQATPQLKQGH